MTARPILPPEDSERLLFKGGTIISMDPLVGDLPKGDVLVEGARIVDVSPHIDAPDAREIDASKTIVIPGFCDPHIHCWEGQLARLIPNQTETPNHPTRNYIQVFHEDLGRRYRPEDIYIGTLATLYSALDGGITTVCDNFHNARTPEHTDASVAALRDSGVRGVLAYGRSRNGVWDQFADAFRLRDTYFSSDDQLTTLRLYMRGRDSAEELEAALRVRTELDLWLTFDSGLGTHPIRELYASGKFNGREVYNHGTDIDPDTRRVMVDGGGLVNVCPRIESQFRTGHIPYREWVDAGTWPALSNDDPGTYSIDMFREMQSMYAYERAAEHRSRTKDSDIPQNPITLRRMLEAATIRGAENCGLGHEVGSLTPGKQADIVLIRADTFRTHPIQNAIATVVQGADIGTVESVFVAGRAEKWNGSLLTVDGEAVRQRIESSRDYLLSAANWPLGTIDFTE